MSDNYNVYVNDDTEPNVSVSADSDVSALVDDDSNVVLNVEEDAGALLNAEINDEELVDVPIEETIGELGADHRRLLHRDAADQHPMSAITGLTDSLTGLQNTIDSGLISVETSVSDVTLLANGKNTVYHSSTMPTGGEYKVGDTWFNSSESYCMYKWDGSNWIREQFGNGAFANASIWNATIRDGAITNAKIEDATIEGAKIKDATITNAKISSLNGDKITANSLTIGKMASDVTDAISAAGETASNYITTISGLNGICVHDVNDTSNYVNLNSNGMGVFAGGSLASSFSSGGINIYENSNNVASFGSTLRLGRADLANIQIPTVTETSSGYHSDIQFYYNGTMSGKISSGSSRGYYFLKIQAGDASMSMRDFGGGTQELGVDVKMSCLDVACYDLRASGDITCYSLTSSGDIIANGHSSAIGTIKNAYLSSNKSVAPETGTALCNVSLEAGTWVVTCGVRFPANATGVRRANLTTTSGDADIHIQLSASSNNAMQLAFTRIATPSSTTTYYLNAWHNASSSLTLPSGSSGAINYIRAVRII